ncbi:hypothetical protein AB6D34_09420 [Pectobacterium brasiliense]|uniref:Phage tail protein n=1 Tax=Pectobacterium brasiliense TaxID=180957 RepID=A0A3S1AKD4_9GAMM|nr:MULTISPECIES: hypothetical protein [Pectobacterium]GKV75520.1 hypothetical protein PEC106568_06940 [Pectobacterium carotovorum subsp. carotovorum]MBN3046509.1 hypothetical protein [Pectobacterium brasiliense]MBN3056762.1 hypothetical protein [Pectobacterium brasiliense]MBN3075358.1 hypothetical protein [Pectobacterium brasiliense]MBN3083516.1 hypothetical protein [Pectobacterium brasiliense]
MAMKRYGADGANLTLFGIPIDDFGDTDPPITIEDLEPRATLKRGIGKTSVRLDSQTRPKRVTVNLIPGSDQVRQILAVEKTGVDATFSFFQTGTAETVMGFDGVLVNRGSMTRGGKTSVSDEQFIFEFADSEET